MSETPEQTRRREYLETVGMWPERAGPRRPKALCEGDRRRARLQIGAPDDDQRHRHYGGLYRSHQGRVQTEIEKAKRRAAWSPEKRAAAAERARAAAPKLNR